MTGHPERDNSYSRKTIGLPRCEPDHPPRNEWPSANLARGICPQCGWHEGPNQRSARVLRARRLIEERERDDA